MRVGTKQTYVASNIRRVPTKPISSNTSVEDSTKKMGCQWAPLSVRGPNFRIVYRTHNDVLGLSVQTSSSSNRAYAVAKPKNGWSVPKPAISNHRGLIFEVMRLGSHCRGFFFFEGN
jgi:hypothetical protein